MERKKSGADYAREAAQAHTDLNVFAAVVSLLEGGHISADVQPDDFEIIRIAKRAQQKCLRRYDRAIAHINQ